MSETNKLQTPEETLERWMSIQCSCDPDVGHLCEVCHDIQVMRDLIKDKAELIEALRKTLDIVRIAAAGHLVVRGDYQPAAELLRKHGG